MIILVDIAIGTLILALAALIFSLGVKVVKETFKKKDGQ